MLAAAVPPCVAARSVAAGAPPASRPVPRTLAHELLDLEAKVFDVPADCRRRLDTLVRDAVRRLTVRPSYTRRQALHALQAIDDTLTAHNFVCSVPAFTVDRLSRGLTPRPLDARVAASSQNARRRDHIRRHADEPFCHVDCDISCLLYLAVAERLHLPVTIVDANGHNFLRWHLTAKEYINWDTNFSAPCFTDRQYQVRRKIPPPLVAKGVYLRSMSRNEIKGYHHSALGNALCDAGRFGKAIEFHKKAVALYPRSPMVWNNLAWAYVTAPGERYRDRGRLALPHAERAVAIHRKPGYLDTLACAHAERGAFDRAIRLEQEALRREAKPYFREMIDVFRLRKTYLEHQADMRRALAAVRRAGPGGATKRKLAEELGLAGRALEVVLGGLKRTAKIASICKPGQTVYAATKKE